MSNLLPPNGLNLEFFFFCRKRDALHRITVPIAAPASLELQTKSAGSEKQARRCVVGGTRHDRGTGRSVPHG